MTFIASMTQTVESGRTWSDADAFDERRHVGSEDDA